MKTNQIVDLSLLLRLVSELEKIVGNAANIHNSDADSQEYLIEISKAIGLCSSLSQEAILLVGDMAHLFSKKNASANTESNELENILVNKKKGLN